MTDLAIMRERLRRETASLLGLDLDNLTPAQAVRLDRAATIRLELDDIESRKLAGAAFDVSKYILISEALERMLGGQPDAPATDAFADAKQELAEFLERRADAIAARDEKLRDQMQEREEQAAIAAASLEPDAPRAPALPPEPPRPNNVVPLSGVDRANMALPPRGYLKEDQREAWERGGRVDGPHPWPLPQ